MLIVENLPIQNLIGVLSDDELFDFCATNDMLRIERDSEQNIIIMSPLTIGSGFQESELLYQLAKWTKKDGTGLSFSSAAGFILPNKAMRSPDASWMSKEKWSKISPKDRQKFSPEIPEFVIELRSKSDLLKTLHKKCVEWIENGVQLLWLIDPKTETSWIYRANGSREEVKGFAHTLSGEDVLPGFQFPLEKLYPPA